MASLLLALSGCGLVGGGAQAPTPTAMPTSSIPGLQVISSQACQVAKQLMIRVEHPQGNLIAWSPEGDRVAYVATTQGSSWNVGELDLLTAPKFDAPLRLASQAAGELTWSPDSSAIAYLGLRNSDNLYTVGLAYPDGRTSTDLFPGEAARTDEYSSQKYIQKWLDTGKLRLSVSCGFNCLQTVDLDVQTGRSTPVGNTTEKPLEIGAVQTSNPTPMPTAYASFAGQLNWSPDEKHIAYIDTSGATWVIDVLAGSMYPLEIGTYATAVETDWSPDSLYLAVHADLNLFVFSLRCP